MKLNTIIYEKEDHIAKITLNRPEVRNAMSDELLLELIRALDIARSDKDVRVVVLKGGGVAFCSGRDLKEVSQTQTMQDIKESLAKFQELAKKFARLDKPVIAAVQGYAYGGGFILVIMCDLRIAAKGTKFRFMHPTVGGPMLGGITQTLPRIVGITRAKELALIGDTVDAEELERWGLVNRVVPEEKLEQATMEMARKIANNIPAAVSLSRIAMDCSMDASFEAQLELELAHGCTGFGLGLQTKGAEAALKELKRKKAN